MPGRTDDVLLDETMVNSQCYFCNCERQGNWPGYYLFMLGICGQNGVNGMVNEYMRGHDRHYTSEQLAKLEVYYQGKADRLLKKG